MSFLKFQGNQLFTGTRLLDENQVLITDEAGNVQEITAPKNAGLGIQHVDGILCPGFVNAHCHLELSYLKAAVPPHTGMVPFLLQVMGSRFGNKERIGQAIADAEKEMWLNGIVAVGDICNTADTVVAKQSHRLYYQNFIEVSGFVPATAGTRLEAVQAVAAQFEAIFPKEQVSITPHAPYSVSPQLFNLITNLPGNNLLTLHNQESEAEGLFFTQKKGDFLKLFDTIGVNLDFFQPTGRNSLPSVCTVMHPATKQWLLVHNCFTTAQDIEDSHLSKAGTFFCLCPGANLYIGNPLPDVEMLKQSGYTICLGTDSLASNTQLSILAEMRLLQDHFPQLPLADLLQWATLNGAKALQVDNRFGSFERGKQPGVLVLENVVNGIANKSVVRRLI